jgi:hypothetical protein
MAEGQAMTAKSGTETRGASGTPPPPARGEEARALLERAHKGDATCLPQLRALFADPDRGTALVEACGSPAVWLRETLLGQTAGKDLAVKEAEMIKLAQVQAELEGPNPTAVEKLLAERAAVCWFLVNRYEERYARAEGLSIKQAEYHQRRIDAAHRRYLSALKTLATVRKLAVPAIQVNIAKRQVNLAGSQPGA